MSRLNSDERRPPHGGGREIPKSIVISALALTAANTESSCGLGAPIAIGLLAPPAAGAHVRAQVEPEWISIRIKLERP